MKKKKVTAVAVAGAEETSPEDIKKKIKDQSKFFDELIELIPPRFYLTNDEEEEEGSSKPSWFKGLSRAAKSAAKKQTRVNLRLSRRIRLDPDIPSSTLDKLRQSITINNNNKSGNEGEERDDDDVERSGGVTYEGLRERLKRRIEELRGNRGSDATSRKRKMENQRARDLEGGRATTGKKTSRFVEKVSSSSAPSSSLIEAAAKGVEFGKVKLVDDEGEKSKKRRKLSKEKMLEKAKELEEAKRDPEKGAEVAKKHSLNAALSRAAGVKVHDNPARIKESMNKKKKQQEKNAGKWKERVASTEKLRNEKQQKRAGNIAERSQQAKMRKIAKREKKLMRPGFEGRKEGYLNQ